MDIATIIGIVGGFAVLLAAILLEGSSPLSFVNLLPAVVVVGGSAMAIMVRYTYRGLMSALSLGIKSAIFYKHVSQTELIDKIAEIADMMRRHGPIALQQIKVDDPFIRLAPDTRVATRTARPNARSAMAARSSSRSSGPGVPQSTQ